MANIRTNQDVLNDQEVSKDNYFLLGELNETNDGYSIDVGADHVCVAINQSSAEMLDIIWRKEWDKPDTRPAICVEYGLSENTRMIGAGGIVSVQIGDEEPRTVLFEKTGGPSKGKMSPAGGLSDANPLQVLWAQLIEETGILTVDRDNQKLSLILLEPEDDCDPAFANVEEQQAFLNISEQEKYDQIDNIREQLPEDVRDWEIVVERKKVDLSLEDRDYLDHITINLPSGDAIETRAIISDSDKTANVNILRPVRLELPKGSEIICVDPEVYQRLVQLFTRAEMLTPEFIRDKASVPMVPYLKAAMDREIIAEPQIDADIGLVADDDFLDLYNLE